MSEKLKTHMKRVRDYYRDKEGYGGVMGTDELLKRIIHYTGMSQSDENSNDNLLGMEELQKHRQAANNLWTVQSERPITSHRRVIGRFIVLGKKVLRKISRWYINPIVEQQNEFNAQLTGALNEICNRLIVTEGKFSELNGRINESFEQLNSLIDKRDTENNRKLDDTGSQTPPTDAVPPDQKKTGVVTATSLNVRSGPGTNNHAMGMIVKGTKITILETSAEWYKIAYNNSQGFVSAQYIQLQQTADNPAKPQTAVVVASSLNVRSGPGTQHGRIGSLSQNSQVSVLETNNGWSKVQQSSLVGFVDSRYLKAAPANQTANRGDTTKSGTVIATSLNIRSGAGTQYKVVGSLLQNNKVEILELSGQWYKIKSGRATGYVHSDYIKLQ